MKNHADNYDYDPSYMEQKAIAFIIEGPKNYT